MKSDYESSLSNAKRRVADMDAIDRGAGFDSGNDSVLVLLRNAAAALEAGLKGNRSCSFDAMVYIQRAMSISSEQRRF